MVIKTVGSAAAASPIPDQANRKVDKPKIAQTEIQENPTSLETASIETIPTDQDVDHQVAPLLLGLAREDRMTPLVRQEPFPYRPGPKGPLADNELPPLMTPKNAWAEFLLNDDPSHLMELADPQTRQTYQKLQRLDHYKYYLMDDKALDEASSRNKAIQSTARRVDYKEGTPRSERTDPYSVSRKSDERIYIARIHREEYSEYSPEQEHLGRQLRPLFRRLNDLKDQVFLEDGEPSEAEQEEMTRLHRETDQAYLPFDQPTYLSRARYNLTGDVRHMAFVNPFVKKQTAIMGLPEMVIDGLTPIAQRSEGSDSPLAQEADRAIDSFDDGQHPLQRSANSAEDRLLDFEERREAFEQDVIIHHGASVFPFVPIDNKILKDKPSDDSRDFVLTAPAAMLFMNRPDLLEDIKVSEGGYGNNREERPISGLDYDQPLPLTLNYGIYSYALSEGGAAGQFSHLNNTINSDARSLWLLQGDPVDEIVQAHEFVHALDSDDAGEPDGIMPTMPQSDEEAYTKIAGRVKKQVASDPHSTLWPLLRFYREEDLEEEIRAFQVGSYIQERHRLDGWTTDMYDRYFNISSRGDNNWWF